MVKQLKVSLVENKLDPKPTNPLSIDHIPLRDHQNQKSIPISEPRQTLYPLLVQMIRF